MARFTLVHRTGAIACALAMAASLTAPAVATATTRDASIPMSCRATPSGVPIGGKDFHASGINATVTAPDKIEVGKVAEVSFQIHPIHIRMPKLPLGAKFVDASRMKVDFRIPPGLKFEGAQIAGSGNSLEGFTAKIVNEAGHPDPNGSILRLVGRDDATVGHSPNVSVNEAGGIIVPVDETQMTISFPQVITRFKAVAPGTQVFAVNTKGKAGQYNTDENFFSILVHVQAPVVGSVWASARCTPRRHEDDPINEAVATVAKIKVVAAANSDATPRAGAAAPTAEPGDPQENSATAEEVPEEIEPSELTAALEVLRTTTVQRPEYLSTLMDLG